MTQEPQRIDFSGNNEGSLAYRRALYHFNIDREHERNYQWRTKYANQRSDQRKVKREAEGRRSG
jgi:hypothetical protein